MKTSSTMKTMTSMMMTMSKAVPKTLEFVCNVPGRSNPEDFIDLETSVEPRVIVESDQRFERIGKSNTFKGPPYGNAFTEYYGIYMKVKE